MQQGSEGTAELKSVCAGCWCFLSSCFLVSYVLILMYATLKPLKIPSICRALHKKSYHSWYNLLLPGNFHKLLQYNGAC